MDFRRLRQAYLTVDPRTLGFGRIALSLVLLLDLAKRAVELTTWYTNEGLLPNHTLLWRPTYDPTFSLFYAASWREEAAFGFLVCAAAYLSLLVGYRTRLAQIASFVCVLSLHGRLLFIQNGGDVVLSELTFWTMFLPTGRRYSFDSLLGRRRLEAGESAVDSGQPEVTPVVSLAVLAFTVQFALIYFLNALQKGGATWREGSVVHYVLHQDRIVTHLGLWARGWLPLSSSQALTWSALALEWTLPVLILSPVATVWARRLAVLGAIALHIGFALFLNLGVFVPAMIAFALHFVPGADVERIVTIVQGWRLTKRMADVFMVILHRTGISAVTRTVRSSESFSAPFSDEMSKYRPWLREGLVAAAIAVCATQVTVENWSVRRLIQIPQPRLFRQTVNYLQLFQGWSMFAPEAPLTDMNIYVDAVTRDGRHVDPYNEVATPSYPHPGPHIPPFLGQNSFHCDYLSRIPHRGDYQQAFREWVLRYPGRTGRREDGIVSFEAFVVEDDSPTPGSTEPTNVRIRRFMQHP